MTDPLETVVPGMPLHHLLYALLVHRARPFSDHHLQESVRDHIEELSYLLPLVSPGCDGTPDHATPLENTASHLLGSSYLRFTDHTHMTLTEEGRAVLMGRLRQEHGFDIVERTKPLAEKVWGIYRENRS